MAEQLENLLDQIGEKFDASFDLPPASSQSPSTPHPLEEPPTPSSSLPTQSPQNSQAERVSLQACEQTPPAPNSPQQGKSASAPPPILNNDLQFSPDPQRREISPQCQGDKPLDLEGDTGEQSDFYYRNLTQRFDQILNKTHSRKTVMAYPTQFMNRMEHFEQRRQTELRNLRKAKEEKEKATLKEKPIVNSKSMQMIHHYSPIQQRYQEVIDNKQKRIDEKVRAKAAKEEAQREQQIREMEEYSENLKEKLGSIRSEEEFYADQQKWLQCKDERVAELRQTRKEKAKTLTTFKPHMNAHSAQMIKKKGGRVPIYDQEPLQMRRPGAGEHCTFTPKINRRRG